MPRLSEVMSEVSKFFLSPILSSNKNRVIGFENPDGTNLYLANDRAQRVNPKDEPYFASGREFTAYATGIVAAGSTVMPVDDASGFYVGEEVICALMGATTGSRTENHKAKIVSKTPNSITISAATLTATYEPNFTVFTMGDVYTVGTTPPGNLVQMTSNKTYEAGQGISIPGAGVAGAEYIGTVKALTADYGVIVDPATSTSIPAGSKVRHDDSEAFILAMIVGAANGLPIEPDNGIYQCNGPQKDLYGGIGSILPAPKVGYFKPPLPGAGTWYPLVNVVIRGKNPAHYMQNYLVHHALPTTKGLILKTDRVGGNLFGGSNVGGGLGDICGVHLVLQNMNLISYPNPNITMVNARKMACFIGSGIQIETWDPGAAIEPTNTNGRALILPSDTNAANIKFEDAGIIGYYEGCAIWEHVHLQNIRIEACKVGLITETGSGYGFTADNLELNGCPTGITARGGSRTMLITRLNVEHPGFLAWDTGGYDIDDANGWLFGKILYDTSTNSVSRRGCANLTIENMKRPRMHVPGTGSALNIYCDGPFPRSGTILQTTGTLDSQGRMQALWSDRFKPNLLKSDVMDAAWTAFNTTKAQSATVFNPDGYAAFTLTEVAGASLQHDINATLTGLKSASRYTLSVLLGPCTALRQLGLWFNGLAGGAYFDSATGLSTNFGNAPFSKVMTALGNGWYLCSVTATVSASDTVRLWIQNTGAGNYNGTGFVNLSNPWLVPGDYPSVTY